MKSYEDIAERVFQKGDEILKRKQKRIALIKKNTLIISEICAAIIVCFGVWKTNDMEILPHRNFPDNVITESENNTEISAPVSTSENKENEIYISQTTAADETDIEREINTSVFAIESAAEITLQDTDIPNKRSTAQAQMPVQTVVQTNLQTTAQNDLQTNLITTKIQPQVTVCTTEQIYDERSYYMKKLASLSVSAILIASSVTPSIGSAKYEIDTSRYWPGEKEIFAKMDSGELDVDINGNGEFDVFDGFLLKCYVDGLSVPDNTAGFKLDSETVNRIKAIADYNNDEIVDQSDVKSLMRYFIASRKMKSEYLDPTYYNPEYTDFDYKYNNVPKPAEVRYAFSLHKNVEALLAGYDIVAEMYEDGSLNLDFNGNGHLDVGDVYDLYIYESLNRENVDTEEIKSDYISDEEWDRCDEAFATYPHVVGGLSIGSRYNFLYYVTLYVAGHTELRPEYFTEEYYQETYSNYYQAPQYWISSRMRDAAKILGLKIDDKVWIKYDEDEFYDFFDAYCNDVENDLRPAPDVNMDGVVDYYDYFAANIYFEDLLNDVTADESILSADIWNNLAENCDFNGNGTSKDIYDILTVQIYVIKYCGNNDAFELAYQDYKTKLGGTSTHTTEAVSYENNLRILSELEKNTVVYGDANCDGKVTIADSTAIMQSLGNPDKYGLSEQGARNADCCNPGDGVTTSDAIAIQKIHSKILSKLPEISK